MYMVEEINIIATNLRKKFEEFNNLLPLIYQYAKEELKFIEKNVDENPGSFAFVENKIIRLKANIIFEEKYYSLDFSEANYEDVSLFFIGINSVENSSEMGDTLYRLKICMKEVVASFCREIYWVKDTHNEKICTQLYAKIHNAENNFRGLITEYMVKVYGLSWFQNFIHPSYGSKANEYQDWYVNNYEEYRNVQAELYNLQVADLVTLLKDSFIDTFGIKYEALQKIAELQASLKEKAADVINDRFMNIMRIWDNDFVDILGADFEGKWLKFSKMRNIVAHNKLICEKLFIDISKAVIDINNILSEARIRVAQKIKSHEEDYAEELYRQWKKDIYRNDAGLDKLPTEDDIIEHLNENEEIAQLLSLLHKYCEEFEDDIASLLELLIDNVNSFDIKKQKICYIKEALHALTEIIYYADKAQAELVHQYIDVIRAKQGLNVVLDNFKKDLKNALDFLNESTSLNQMKELFALGQIARISDLQGNTLELIVEGIIYPDNNSSDNLFIKVLINGDRCFDYDNDIQIDYGTYKMSDGGYAVPYTEEGIVVNIEQVIDCVQEFTTTSLKDVNRLIGLLDK